LELRNDFETFLSLGGMVRVIQVHHQERVVFFLPRVENSRERSHRVSLMPRALEQNAQRLQHIGLIIRNQNSSHGLTVNRVSGAVSIVACQITMPPEHKV